MPSALVWGFVFLFGACIGSFLNVVIYRVPQRLSIVTPRSHCPECKTPVAPWALLPILGFFLTKGRCHHCGAKVSVQYPLVELLTATLTVFIFAHYLSPESVIYHLTARGSAPLGKLLYGEYFPFFEALWLLYVGIALSFIDLEHRILPDVITLPGALISFAIASLDPRIGPLTSLSGAFLGGGLLWAVARAYEAIRGREGLGYGDVKFLLLIGALLGWKGVIYTIAISSLLGTVVGISVGLVRRQGLRVTLPFGPFIAIASVIVHVYGQNIAAFLQGEPGVH